MGFPFPLTCSGRERLLVRHLGLPASSLIHPLLFLLATLLSPWHLQTVTTSADALAENYFKQRADPFALLTGTLRTFQKLGCDLEYMTLRCPTGTTISVHTAGFGKTPLLPGSCQQPSKIQQGHSNSNNVTSTTTCQLPAEIQVVVGVCQKKTTCKFQTSPSGGGNHEEGLLLVPCPGVRKSVEVGYKCKPSEFKSVIGCKGEVIQLKCNRSMRIAIYSANFGRTEYESVQCPQRVGVHEESCLSTFATEIVMQICHGKRGCALEVNPETFGSPCKAESSMYLKVIYACVPRKVLEDAYVSEPERDELFEEAETEYETGDPTEGVKEQPSIYSPDHSKGWVHPKSTSKPNSPSKMKSSSGNSSSGNPGTLWVCITIIGCSSLLLLAIIALFMKKRVVVALRSRSTTTDTNNASSSSSAAPGSGAATATMSKTANGPGESDKPSSTPALLPDSSSNTANAIIMMNTAPAPSTCLSTVGGVGGVVEGGYGGVSLNTMASGELRPDCCFIGMMDHHNHRQPSATPGWTTTNNDPSGVSVSALMTPVPMNFNNYHGHKRTQEELPSVHFY